MKHYTYLDSNKEHVSCTLSKLVYFGCATVVALSARTLTTSGSMVMEERYVKLQIRCKRRTSVCTYVGF